MNEADVKELVAWKESALKQLGKADALKEILPPQYLGWDVYDAVIDYIGKLREAASPIWGVRVGPNVVRTPDGNLIELHTTGGTMQSTEGKGQRVSAQEFNEQFAAEYRKKHGGPNRLTHGYLIAAMEAYSQSGAGPTRVEYRHHGGGGLCESHTGGPHKIEQGCKNWHPVASGAGSPEETKPERAELSGCIHCTEKNGLHRGDCPNGLSMGH